MTNKTTYILKIPMLFYSYDLTDSDGSSVSCLTYQGDSNVVTVSRPKRKGRPSYSLYGKEVQVPPPVTYTVLTWEQVPDGAKKVFAEKGVKAA